MHKGVVSHFCSVVWTAKFILLRLFWYAAVELTVMWHGQDDSTGVYGLLHIFFLRLSSRRSAPNRSLALASYVEPSGGFWHGRTQRHKARMMSSGWNHKQNFQKVQGSSPTRTSCTTIHCAFSFMPHTSDKAVLLLAGICFQCGRSSRQSGAWQEQVSIGLRWRDAYLNI